MAAGSTTVERAGGVLPTGGFVTPSGGLSTIALVGPGVTATPGEVPAPLRMIITAATMTARAATAAAPIQIFFEEGACGALAATCAGRLVGGAVSAMPGALRQIVDGCGRVDGSAPMVGSSFWTVEARSSRCFSMGGDMASSQWTEPMK